jgi:hypothetical protein
MTKQDEIVTEAVARAIMQHPLVGYSATMPPTLLLEDARQIARAAITAMRSADQERGDDDAEWLRAENARLLALLNTPEVDEWAKGATLEAAHQRERWGVDHDAGKTPFDWFWLVGYLAQKAAASAVAGDTEKAKHHTISTGAALANWHLALTGKDTIMRPGIGPENGGEKPGSAFDLATKLSPARLQAKAPETGSADDIRDARALLANGLKELLPATAEALDPNSGIALGETETGAVSAVAKLIGEASNA